MSKDKVQETTQETAQETPIAVVNTSSNSMVQSSGVNTDLMSEFGNFGQAKSAAEVALPFVGILQKMSPQLSKRDPKYIEGATEGCIINSLSSELYCDDGGRILRVIPIDHICRWVEWVPREKGGGLVASHAEKPRGLTQDPSNGRLTNSAGNYINETYYQLAVDFETLSPLIIPCASSNITAFRRWLGLRMAHRLNGHPTPAFFRMWQIGTEWQKNERGEWFRFSFKDAGWVEHKILAEIAGLARATKKDGFEVGRPPEDLLGPDVSHGGTAGGGPIIDSTGKAVNTEDLPF